MEGGYRETSLKAALKFSRGKTVAHPMLVAMGEETT